MTTDKDKKYTGPILNNKGKRPTVNVIEKAQDVLVQFRVGYCKLLLVTKGYCKLPLVTGEVNPRKQAESACDWFTSLCLE
jgi:hypothetical protein